MGSSTAASPFAAAAVAAESAVGLSVADSAVGLSSTPSPVGLSSTAFSVGLSATESLCSSLIDAHRRFGRPAASAPDSLRLPVRSGTSHSTYRTGATTIVSLPQSNFEFSRINPFERLNSWFSIYIIHRLNSCIYTPPDRFECSDKKYICRRGERFHSKHAGCAVRFRHPVFSARGACYIVL